MKKKMNMLEKRRPFRLFYEFKGDWGDAQQKAGLIGLTRNPFRVLDKTFLTNNFMTIWEENLKKKLLN